MNENATDNTGADSKPKQFRIPNYVPMFESGSRIGPNTELREIYRAGWDHLLDRVAPILDEANTEIRQQHAYAVALRREVADAKAENEKLKAEIVGAGSRNAENLIEIAKLKSAMGHVDANPEPTLEEQLKADGWTPSSPPGSMAKTAPFGMVWQCRPVGRLCLFHGIATVTSRNIQDPTLDRIQRAQREILAEIAKSIGGDVVEPGDRAVAESREYLAAVGLDGEG